MTKLTPVRLPGTRTGLCHQREYIRLWRLRGGDNQATTRIRSCHNEKPFATRPLRNPLGARPYAKRSCIVCMNQLWSLGPKPLQARKGSGAWVACPRKSEHGSLTPFFFTAIPTSRCIGPQCCERAPAFRLKRSPMCCHWCCCKRSVGDRPAYPQLSPVATCYPSVAAALGLRPRIPDPITQARGRWTLPFPR